MALNDGRGALERGPIIEKVQASAEIDEEIGRGVLLEVMKADLTGVWIVEEVAASKDYIPYHIDDFTGAGILDVF